jgi:hypothetical protein
MRSTALLLLLVVSSCASQPNTTPTARPAPEDVPKLEKYQHYIENPTDIVGDEVTVILPDFYADDIELSGLGSGWMLDDGKSTWEGTGDCMLELRSLKIHCKELTVTLVPPGDEPEVLIQASGGVSLAQQVRGIGSWFENLALLTIRNDRMRMMEH